MKTNRVHTSLSPHLKLSYAIIIAFHLCGLNNISDNQAPMESWETELCNKHYKTRKEQQIFLDFQILKQEQKETANKAKSFWIFQIPN
jgi:hypothetical protein